MATNEINKELGAKIRRLRNKLKLTQSDLAKEMEFNASETISQIERGDREIKAWELSKFATVLSTSVSDLLTSQGANEMPVVLWRDSPEENKEHKEAYFLKRCEQFALLESLSGVNKGESLPRHDIDPSIFTFKDAENLAIRARQALNLGDRPADKLEETLQNVYGVKIWYLDMPEGSAASTIGPFGPAILMNSREAPWRRNFNFAHELFHLVTWYSVKPLEIIQIHPQWVYLEKLANAFASIFLLPAESLIKSFEKRLKSNKISYSDFIEMARAFSVSTDALLFRLLNLKRLKKKVVDTVREDPLFKDIDRSTMAPKWWQPPIIPERFVRLAFVAFQKGCISRAKLAEILSTSLLDLPNTLQEYGLTDQEGYDAEVRIPPQSDHSFRCKLSTDSAAK